MADFSLIEPSTSLFELGKSAVLPKRRTQPVTMLVNGKELTTFQGLSLDFTIDSACSAFAFSTPFYPDRPLSNFFRHYGNEEVIIKYKGTEILTGVAEICEPSYSISGATVKIQGRSRTGVLVDADCPPPFFHKNLTFNQFADQYSGLVKADPDTQKFPVIQYDAGTKIYDVLTKIGAGQGLWAVPQSNGDLIFLKIPSSTPVVAKFRDGQDNIELSSAKTDITKRFNKYIAIKGTRTAEAIDNKVKFDERGLKYVKPDQENASLLSVAERARSQAIIDSIGFEMRLAGWEWEGKLWKAGVFVEIESPLNMIYSPAKFIVKSCVLEMSESDGLGTRLVLALPNAYDNSPITSEPWIKANSSSGISVGSVLRKVFKVPKRGTT